MVNFMKVYLIGVHFKTKNGFFKTINLFSSLKFQKERFCEVKNVFLTTKIKRFEIAEYLLTSFIIFVDNFW